MKYEITTTVETGRDGQGHSLQSPIIKLMADMEPPQIDYPESMAGKLLGEIVNNGELERFRKSNPTFEGKRYKFSRLEADGTFELRKDWKT